MPGDIAFGHLIFGVGKDLIGEALLDTVQLVDRQAGGLVVTRVHHHRQSIESHRDLDVFDAVLRAGVDLLLLDDATGVADLRLADAEPLEAPPVPEKATPTLPSGFSMKNSSATAREMG